MPRRDEHGDFGAVDTTRLRRLVRLQPGSVLERAHAPTAASSRPGSGRSEESPRSGRAGRARSRPAGAGARCPRRETPPGRSACACRPGRRRSHAGGALPPRGSRSAARGPPSRSRSRPIPPAPGTRTKVAGSTATIPQPANMNASGTIKNKERSPTCCPIGRAHRMRYIAPCSCGTPPCQESRKPE
jgi:hypothetical protein